MAEAILVQIDGDAEEAVRDRVVEEMVAHHPYQRFTQRGRFNRVNALKEGREQRVENHDHSFFGGSAPRVPHALHPLPHNLRRILLRHLRE